MLPMIVGAILCGFVPCVAVSNAEAGPSAMQVDLAGQSQAVSVIKGEVLRVEGDRILVKEDNGTEVHMYIDQTTSMSHKILHQGELIEATVDEESHALSITSPDRRNDHALDPGKTMKPPRK
jgi:hypothetical protein